MAHALYAQLAKSTFTPAMLDPSGQLSETARMNTVKPKVLEVIGDNTIDNVGLRLVLEAEIDNMCAGATGA